MKKTFTVLLSTILLFILLVGCGGTKNTIQTEGQLMKIDMDTYLKNLDDALSKEETFGAPAIEKSIFSKVDTESNARFRPYTVNLNTDTGAKLTYLGDKDTGEISHINYNVQSTVEEKNFSEEKRTKIYEELKLIFLNSGKGLGEKDWEALEESKSTKDSSKDPFIKDGISYNLFEYTGESFDSITLTIRTEELGKASAPTLKVNKDQFIKKLEIYTSSFTTDKFTFVKEDDNTDKTLETYSATLTNGTTITLNIDKENGNITSVNAYDSGYTINSKSPLTLSQRTSIFLSLVSSANPDMSVNDVSDFVMSHFIVNNNFKDDMEYVKDGIVYSLAFSKNEDRSGSSMSISIRAVADWYTAKD